MRARWAAILFPTTLLFGAIVPASAQQIQSSTSLPTQPTHDISGVDEAPIGGSIATPLPEGQRRKMRKYDIPEMAGARQALGSQLIDGRLPRPLIDYMVHNGAVEQRLSIFEGGLVVVKMTGAGGNIFKKVLIPPDALSSYLSKATPSSLAGVPKSTIPQPTATRRSALRVYDAAAHPTEREFDPTGVLPKNMHDQVSPLEDLLRAVSEDRTVTSTVANYEPKIGDQLVGDDRRTYVVERVIAKGDVVELRCLSQPTSIYVAKKDLYNYFIGTRAQ